MAQLRARPRGLMDKASDFESEDCEFESRRGRMCFRNHCSCIWNKHTITLKCSIKSIVRGNEISRRSPDDVALWATCGFWISDKSDKFAKLSCNGGWGRLSHNCLLNRCNICVEWRKCVFGCLMKNTSIATWTVQDSTWDPACCLMWWGYSSVAEYSTADREVTGSTPVVPCMFCLIYLIWSINWFDYDMTLLTLGSFTTM